MRAKEFMRAIVLFTVLMIPLFAVGTGAQSVNAAADGALSIVQLNITPQPVIAGQNITIVFQLFLGAE